MNVLSLAAAAFSLALITSSCSEAQSPPPPPVEKSMGASSLPPVEKPMDTGSLPPAEITQEMAGTCNIEAIGEITGAALDAPVPVSGSSFLSGWRTLQANDGSEASAWLRIKDAKGAVAMQVGLPATEDRPDVVEVVNRDSAVRSGFNQVGIAGLPPGTYTLEIVFDTGSEWVRCAHARKITFE